MNRKLIVLGYCLLLTLGLAAQAQVAEKFQPTTDTGNWYIGIRGGIPLGISTFSSFGADKTRAGLNGGIYGGYHFNSVLSLEALATWGKMCMSADKGCSVYWFGVDGNRYFAPVADMNGWNYSDIYSSVTMQQYGVHLNVNILGFFAPTRDSRWSVNLSPALYGVGTKATIKTANDNQLALSGDNQWHLGAGGDLMAEYAITPNLSAGISTGVTYLTGTKMDGMPKHLHTNNMFWQSGIRIGWRFGKGGKSSKGTSIAVAATAPPVTPKPQQGGQPKPIVQEQPKVENRAETVVTPPATEPAALQNQKETLSFPTIYFAFNSITISPSEQPKLEQMLETLRQHPEVCITVTGWCDSQGGVAVNARISKERAEAIKSWLTEKGIADERIAAIGMGTDKTEQKPSKARRAETTDKR